MKRSRDRMRLVCASLVVAFPLLFGPPGAGADESPNYLSDIEVEILHEINLARTQPDRYAAFIEEWLPYYDGVVRKLPDRIPTVTKEGKKALEEAIQFLRDVEPIKPLVPSEGMTLGARDHVGDMGPSGATGHVGFDNSRAGDRVNRHGTWGGRIGENIFYGGEDARTIVMGLIIDDGVEKRGHRTILFDDRFHFVGVSFGAHRSFGTMCVITFAADYTE